MEKNRIRFLFGMAIAAGTMAAARPAAATNLLKDLATDSHGNAYYLGVSGGPQCNSQTCWINDGTQLIIYTRSGLDQDWEFSLSGSTRIQDLESDNDNPRHSMCIDLVGFASAGQGANAIVEPCSSASEQVWYFVAASQYQAPFPGCYVIENAHTAEVLGVSNGTMTNGTHIIQWPLFTGTPNQDIGWHHDQFWCPQ
ncbi:MAG TPA: RICIN domain-containing protein [Polyangia bacterium]|nr:RICIN domain-containing protein [Polyangia bacterium]